MSDDLAAQFSQMQRYAFALRDLVNSAQSQSPSQAEGSDRTGAISVTLGPDGIPSSFLVKRDWNRRLDPESFAGAVFEAFQSAMGDRLSNWGNSLIKNGWQQRVDDLQAGKFNTTPESRIPAAFRRPATVSAPRSLGEVTEDVLKAFDSATHHSMQSRTASGTDQSGHLTIGLSASGMLSCTADSTWVAGQTAARLMNALGQALARAKETLANESQSQKDTTGPDKLIAEAFALLLGPDSQTEKE